MNIIIAGELILDIILGLHVFIKFRREIKYEIRDNWLKIKRKKLQNLYRAVTIRKLET